MMGERHHVLGGSLLQNLSSIFYFVVFLTFENMLLLVSKGTLKYFLCHRSNF